MKKIDEFDAAYRDRVRKAAMNAIILASHDPATNVAAMRNHEIYDALMEIMALLLATSKSSPSKIREISDDFSRSLRKRVAAIREDIEKSGRPFDVIHSDDLQ
jgi:hypothetical protein